MAGVEEPRRSVLRTVTAALLPAFTYVTHDLPPLCIVVSCGCGEVNMYQVVKVPY